MKTFAPSLSPLLRSDAQGLLLAQLFLDASKQHSVSALASVAGVSVSSAMREVDRLVEAGFVVEKRIGRTRLISANAGHQIFGAVRELVLYAYGPVAVLTPLVNQISGVKRAFIYGSWAARISGQTGNDPGDIDVLLVGEVTSRVRSELGAAAAEVMGREVNVHNLSEKDWLAQESGFIKTVKARPMIELQLGDTKK